RSVGAIASNPQSECRSGMSRNRAAGGKSVREGWTGSCFLAMRSKRTGHAAKTRQRMVGVFADGKVQLHRSGNGWDGELHRSCQLSRNGKRRPAAKSGQVETADVSRSRIGTIA